MVSENSNFISGIRHTKSHTSYFCYVTTRTVRIFVTIQNFWGFFWVHVSKTGRREVLTTYPVIQAMVSHYSQPCSLKSFSKRQNQKNGQAWWPSRPGDLGQPESLVHRGKVRTNNRNNSSVQSLAVKGEPTIFSWFNYTKKAKKKTVWRIFWTIQASYISLPGVLTRTVVSFWIIQKTHQFNFLRMIRVRLSCLENVPFSYPTPPTSQSHQLHPSLTVGKETRHPHSKLNSPGIARKLHPVFKGVFLVWF